MKNVRSRQGPRLPNTTAVVLISADGRVYSRFYLIKGGPNPIGKGEGKKGLPVASDGAIAKWKAKMDSAMRRAKQHLAADGVGLRGVDDPDHGWAFTPNGFMTDLVSKRGDTTTAATAAASATTTATYTLAIPH